MNNTRRNLLKTIGASSGIALAGCSSSETAGNSGTKSGQSDSANSGSSQQTTTQSNSGQDNSYHIGFAIMGLGGDPWMGAFLKGAKWYAQDMGLKLTVTDGQFDVTKQINDMKRLIRQDVDAILTSPVQSDASVKVVEQANQQNIPVFTANSTASTSAVPMFTAFGNADAAATAADVMANRLKQRFGSAKGSVAEVMLPQKSETFVARHKGFVNGLNKYDNINIDSQFEYDQTQQDATNKISTQLQRGDFDALYCPDLLSGLAAMSAFENEGVKKPIGNKSHITTIGLDAGPTTLDAIRNGYFDAAVDQPNLFYAPISMKYMVDYLDAGQKSTAIPDPGKKFTKGDLTISTGNKHDSIDPWAKPLWAPAQVEKMKFDDGSQTFFKTSGVVVDKDNADAPYLWGNLK